MDDILIYSRDIEEYTTYVRVVLERLRKYSLYIKLLKYKFSIKEVSFLEYRVKVDSVTINFSKVTIIKD